MWSLIAFFFSAVALGAQPRGPWFYINSFQSGKLFVFDLATAKVIHTIPVQDGSGSIGVAITSDGRKLFVVDGDRRHRLRTFDTVTAKVLREYPFKDRVLLLGRGPVIHLTADDRWLFLQTYDYGAAASGVRIFNVGAGSFTRLGLRGRECGSPNLASARNGTLIAVCPKLAHELRPLPAAPGEFLPGPRVSTPIAEAADVALSPDGSDLYVLEYVKEGAPWRLVHWPKGDEALREHDLRQLLDVAADAPGRGGRAWLDVSPDGKWFGLVHGPRVWILERQTLKVLHSLHLPWPADDGAFTLDGRELLTFRGSAGGAEIHEALLLRVSVISGNLQNVRLKGLKFPWGPTNFKVAPAP